MTSSVRLGLVLHRLGGFDPAARGGRKGGRGCRSSTQGPDRLCRPGRDASDWQGADGTPRGLDVAVAQRVGAFWGGPSSFTGVRAPV